jgi:hypothetical protein
MYLVLSAFTSSPISLEAATKASVILFTVMLVISMCFGLPQILTNITQNVRLSQATFSQILKKDSTPRS